MMPEFLCLAAEADQDLNEPITWISDSTHVILGKSSRSKKMSSHPIDSLFPVQVTGITQDDKAIYASILLPNGPQLEISKPYLVVATRPNSDARDTPPGWGDTQRLFLPNLKCRLVDDGNVIYLKLTDESREEIIRSVTNLGYDII